MTNGESRKERAAALSLLQRLNRIWVAVLMMMVMVAGVLLVAVLLLRVSKEIRSYAEEARNQARETRATAEIVNGCTNPAGACFQNFTRIGAEQAQERLDAIIQTLNKSRDELLAGQQKNAQELLRQIEATTQRLSGLQTENQGLNEQIAALLVEVATLRQIIERTPPPVGSTVVNPPPPPSNVTCSLLPPTLGVLVGCKYG